MIGRDLIKHCKGLLLLFVCLFWTANLCAQIKINEICASNDSILIDQFGNYPDWIELYNDRPFDVNLQGLFLSDNEDKPMKFPLPNKVIPSNGFLVVFASNDSIIGQEIHTNFKLNRDGEFLSISNSDGEILDNIFYPKLSSDESYGRQEDGQSTWAYFTEPTPNESNSGTNGYLSIEQPESSHESGFYSETITVLYTAKSSDQILRYTLDASPVKKSSPILDKPLTINETTNVRVRAYNQEEVGGKDLNQIFFFDVNHTLPIVHLSSDPDNFYDWEEGILVKGPDAELEEPYFGANFWKDTEIPVHFDYFIDNELVRSYDLGLKVHGGKASRSNKMQSLRLMADKEWGDEEMNYPFFDESHVRDYKRLVLRNASGDYHYTHFRDGYMARYYAKEKLDVDLIQFKPTVVYINGEYYGVLHLREKIDRHYLKTHYDVERDEIDLLEKDSQVVEGNFDLFNEHFDLLMNSDLKEDNNFALIEKHFDVDHYIDYVASQSLVNNTDWPRNNIKFWRKKDGGKWRYFLFDMDVGMGRYPWTMEEENYLGDWVDTLSGARFYDMLVALWQNEGYKERFVTRYADLLNTTFRSEHWLKETEETIEILEPELKRQFITWESEARYTWWKAEAVPSILNFTERRDIFAREFLRERFDLSTPISIEVIVDPPSAGSVHVNTISPENFPWTGEYFEDYSTRFQVEENPSYSFSHWDINQGEEILTDREINLFLKDGAEVRAIFEGNFPGMKVSISPNPGRQFANVSFNNPYNGMVDITIFSTEGKKLHQQKDEDVFAGKQTISVPHGITQAGIYILEIRSMDETSITKMVIQ